MDGWGDLDLYICDSGQLLNVKWLTGIIFFPKQVILVNKIVDLNNRKAKKGQQK